MGQPESTHVRILDTMADCLKMLNPYMLDVSSSNGVDAYW